MQESFVHKNVSIKLQYTESLYVSPFSLFLEENIPDNLQGLTICDFGAGTGIIGMAGILNGSTDVVFIEKFDEHLDICSRNVRDNFSTNGDLSISIGKICPEGINFDYIFCNPASLPSFVGNDPFFYGGEFGLDMINEVIRFSDKHLKSEGHLYLLVTSILPLKMIKNSIINSGFEYKIKNKTTIPFRPHYQGIAEWVDKNNATIGNEGGYYIKKCSNYYEDIQLFDIVRV